MNHAEAQPAWVLHRRPYGETSTLLELFSRDLGRVGAIARGVQRRGWGGLLEPFVPLHISWRGRGELKTVVGVDPCGRPYRPQGGAVACGFYLAELLLALTHREDPHPRTWQAYGVAVAGLSGESLEPALRGFELALLEESGYGLELTVDVDGAPLLAERLYCYRPDRGAVAVEASAHGGVAVHGATLLALADDPARLGDEPLRSEARTLMRVVLDHHLGGRRLRSREMFAALRNHQQSES